MAWRQDDKVITSQAADLLSPIVACTTYGPILHFLLKHQFLVSQDRLAKKGNQQECLPQDSEHKTLALLNQYINYFFTEINLRHIPRMSILKVLCFNFRDKGQQSSSIKSWIELLVLYRLRNFAIFNQFQYCITKQMITQMHVSE